MRCPSGGVGRYRIALRVANHPEPYRVQIGGHSPVFQFTSAGTAVFGEDGAAVVLDGPPAVSNDEPFEGELCEHELWFVEHGIPGRDYRPEFEFSVEHLDG